MLKAGARDSDRAAGLDLFTVYSEFKSTLDWLICFTENKNKHAPDVYVICPGNANPDNQQELNRTQQFQKTTTIKAQLFTLLIFKTQHFI